MPKPTVLLQRWLLIVEVTVRTILQRTAIRFGNTSGFGNDLKFPSYVFYRSGSRFNRALCKNLLIFLREV